MGWKDYSYWLRGGIVSLVIGVILFLYLLSQSSCIGLNIDGTSNCPTGLVDIFIFNLHASFLQIVTVLIIFFLIGALIGWIYGIIKNRK